VLKVLAKARVDKKTVKVIGNGHSPSDIACTHGYMVSLKNFNKILKVRVVLTLTNTFLLSAHRASVNCCETRSLDADYPPA